jgi:serine/threonine protein kinase
MLMILQQPPPTGELYGDTSYSFAASFHDMVKKCLKKNPLKRPTAAKLLTHKFFAKAKDLGPAFVLEQVLKKLPPPPIEGDPLVLEDCGMGKSSDHQSTQQTNQAVSVPSFVFKDMLATLKQPSVEAVTAPEAAAEHKQVPAEGHPTSSKTPPSQ